MLNSCPPDSNVKRALAAVADMGLFKTDHERTEFRQRQPLWHLASQYAALGFRSDLALSGDDQHESESGAMGAVQKARQLAVGARLRHAVQIEPSVDLFFPSR